MSPLDIWILTVRWKATPLTVMVLLPRDRACALPKNQLPLATVLATR